MLRCYDEQVDGCRWLGSQRSKCSSRVTEAGPSCLPTLTACLIRFVEPPPQLAGLTECVGHGSGDRWHAHRCRPRLLGRSPRICARSQSSRTSRARSGVARRGRHIIAGIADGFVPGIVSRRLDEIEKVVAVPGEEALDEMRRPARDHGLFVGPSSGAHLVAARKTLHENPDLAQVVTVLCERGREVSVRALRCREKMTPDGRDHTDGHEWVRQVGDSILRRPELRRSAGSMALRATATWCVNLPGYWGQAWSRAS